jgi:hypothetical protein
MTYVALAAQALLLVTFALSVGGKLHRRSGPAEFTRSLVSLRLFGWRTSKLVSPTVITTELVIVVALLVPATRQIGAALALALLGVFEIGIAMSIRRGAGASCACFGVARRPLGRLHLIRNAVLAAAAGVAIVVHASDAAAGPAAVAASAGLAAGLLTRFLEDIVDLLASPVRPARGGP